jgi:hypothetical protein
MPVKALQDPPSRAQSAATRLLPLSRTIPSLWDRGIPNLKDF